MKGRNTNLGAEHEVLRVDEEEDDDRVQCARELKPVAVPEHKGHRLAMRLRPTSKLQAYVVNLLTPMMVSQLIGSPG